MIEGFVRRQSPLVQRIDAVDLAHLFPSYETTLARGLPTLSQDTRAGSCP